MEKEIISYRLTKYASFMAYKLGILNSLSYNLREFFIKYDLKNIDYLQELNECRTYINKNYKEYKDFKEEKSRSIKFDKDIKYRPYSHIIEVLIWKEFYFKFVESQIKKTINVNKYMSYIAEKLNIDKVNGPYLSKLLKLYDYNDFDKKYLNIKELECEEYLKDKNFDKYTIEVVYDSNTIKEENLREFLEYCLFMELDKKLNNIFEDENTNSEYLDSLLNENEQLKEKNNLLISDIVTLSKKLCEENERLKLENEELKTILNNIKSNSK